MTGGAGLSASQFEALRRLVRSELAAHRHSATYLRQTAHDAGIPADYADVREACRAESVEPVDLNHENLYTQNARYERDIRDWKHRR